MRGYFLRATLPSLSEEERGLLESDILANGCRDPLRVWGSGDGMVLIDGHNRFEICMRLGLAYETVVVDLADDDAVFEWMYVNQLSRRNLTNEQRTLMIGRLYNQRKKMQGGNGSNQYSEQRGQNEPFAKTAETLASEYGISKSTVKRAGKFAKDVDANPALKKAVCTDRVAVKDIKKEERRAAQLRKEKAAARANNKVGWKVTDKQDVIQCNVLVTDPPYGILDEDWDQVELESFTREWAARWNECGADLIVITWSERHLFKGKVWFDEALKNYKLQQLLNWSYLNNKSPQSKLFFKHTHEPVFLYRRVGSEKTIEVGSGEWGKDLTDFDCHVAAVPQSNFNDENMKQHPAQKPVSLMRWLVNATSRQGELVVDPFCGSGTTGVACRQLNRRFHGVEKDKGFIKIAKNRISAYGTLSLVRN